MATPSAIDKKTGKLQEQIAEALNDGSKTEFVKDLRRQLGEHLAQGAKKCPNCGYDPVGMLKTPGYFDARNQVDMPPVYEVGCVVCPPVYVKRDDGEERKLDGKKARVKRRSYSARGTSVEQAVERWNNEDFVEDTKFGLNVTPQEHARLD